MSDEGGGNPWASGARGLISDLIDQGLSATAGLEQARDLGVESIRTQTWYDLWGETAAAKANAGEFFDVDYATPLGAESYTDWAAGRAGTYGHQVGVVVRDLESGAEWVVEYTAISDSPMTPQQAVDEALAVYTQGTTAEGGTFEERIRGGFLKNAYRFTGPKR